MTVMTLDEQRRKAAEWAAGQQAAATLAEAERQAAAETQRLELERDLANAKVALKDAADLRAAAWSIFETALTFALNQSQAAVRAWESYQSADSRVGAHAGQVAQLEMALSGESLETGHGNVLSFRAEVDMHRNAAMEQAGVQPLVYRLPASLSEAALGLVDALQVPIRPAAQPQPPINWAQFEVSQSSASLDPSPFENKAAVKEDTELQRYQQWEASHRKSQQ